MKSRLLKSDDNPESFRVKNYRANGPARCTTMTLDVDDFIRRFLLHVLPKGFHRTRHDGLLATGQRADNIACARKLLGVTMPADAPADAVAADDTASDDLPLCPCCGSRQRITETFLRGETQRHHASLRPIDFKIDTS